MTNVERDELFRVERAARIRNLKTMLDKVKKVWLLKRAANAVEVLYVGADLELHNFTALVGDITGRKRLKNGGLKYDHGIGEIVIEINDLCERWSKETRLNCQVI